MVKPERLIKRLTSHNMFVRSFANKVWQCNTPRKPPCPASYDYEKILIWMSNWKVVILSGLDLIVNLPYRHPRSLVIWAFHDSTNFNLYDIEMKCLVSPAHRAQRLIKVASIVKYGVPGRGIITLYPTLQQDSRRPYWHIYNAKLLHIRSVPKGSPLSTRLVNAFKRKAFCWEWIFRKPQGNCSRMLGLSCSMENYKWVNLSTRKMTSVTIYS